MFFYYGQLNRNCAKPPGEREKKKEIKKKEKYRKGAAKKVEKKHM